MTTKLCPINEGFRCPYLHIQLIPRVCRYMYLCKKQSGMICDYFTIPDACPLEDAK